MRGGGTDTEGAALTSLIAEIDAPTAASELEVRAHLDELTKPRGSLGELEEIALRLGLIFGPAPPPLTRRVLFVLAGDHGVVARGVSAYPSEVTRQMCLNIADGGAAVSVLARRVGTEVVVADLGVQVPVEHAAVLDLNIRRGTDDLSRGAAMDRAHAERAIVAGAGLVARKASTAHLIGLGEMGIGNSTAAAAITAAHTGAAIPDVVGLGTGVTAEQLEDKARVVEAAVDRLPTDPDPLDVLAAVGGLEIAGLVGVVLGAARRRIPVVTDGFIATAAALLAVRLAPVTRNYLFASHVSAEPGHRVQLAALELRPILDLGMRLGEGTGAALAFPVLDCAAAVLREMATFASAGVARRSASEASPAETIAPQAVSRP